LLDGLFEHPGLFDRQFNLKDFNGVLCINRVFPQPADGAQFSPQHCPPRFGFPSFSAASPGRVVTTTWKNNYSEMSNFDQSASERSGTISSSFDASFAGIIHE